ncbi:MAG: hypothetical protein K6L75_05350 [Cellvibrionaceae bacterium]
MKELTNLNPNTLQDDARVVFSYAERSGKFDYEYFYFLIIDNDYAIWAYRTFRPERTIQGEQEPETWLGGTLLEFPKQALPWFIKSIEEKFFKTEAEGGLKKGEFTYSEIFNDEKMVVKRMFGLPGYALSNFARQSYAYTTLKSPQCAEFTDQMLFDNGLFDQLKQLGEKIARGQL